MKQKENEKEGGDEQCVLRGDECEQQSLKRPQADAAAKDRATLTHAADIRLLLQLHSVTVSDISTEVQSSNSNQGANLAAKDLAGPP
jgi:hypothetical protein